MRLCDAGGHKGRHYKGARTTMVRSPVGAPTVDVFGFPMGNVYGPGM